MLLASFTRLSQLALAFGPDVLILPGQSGLGRDITDGAVKPDLIIVLYKLSDNPPGLLEGKRGLGADCLAFDGFVPAFQFAITLGIAGGDADMGHATGLDKQLELASDELGAIVRDEAWSGGGELLAGALQDDFHVRFGHLLPDFPMDDKATVAIQDRAQVVKDAAQVEVGRAVQF